MFDEKKELNWGILGCGGIANDFIVAAAASSLERAAEFLAKQKLQDSRAYGSYAELLEDENVHIVYIALLNHSHLEWTLKALDAGKHVLVEKPIAVNSREVRQIVEKARETKKFVMEAMWTRKVVSTGELGPTTDIGVYCVAAAVEAFGDEKPVDIRVVGEKDESGIEKWANVTLRFSNDRHALIYFNGNHCTPSSAFISFEGGRIEKFVKVRGGLDGERELVGCSTKDKADYHFLNSDGLHFEADHVYDQILAAATSLRRMSEYNAQADSKEYRAQPNTTMPGTNELRWGILGCGKISHDFARAVWKKVKEIIKSGELGKPVSFNANFGMQLAENRFHLDKGQTPLIDIGIYCISCSMFCFNDEKPEDIAWSGHINSDGVDEWANLTLKYPGGKHACLYYNGTIQSSTNATLVLEEGRIEFPLFFWCPEEINVFGSDRYSKPKNFAWPFKGDKGEYNLPQTEGLKFEADHFFECVQKGAGESDVMPLNSSLALAEVVEAIRTKMGVKYAQD
ncbi:Trans-1,2-dihydrobenzene-1,2-diol dehydrogenase [Aphelenchoides fujianensis]|nr:Trans-1,2-dihydrobenzene-1,2-diol dehydrogenase [Aphelenchoides fujianensis]